jgi:hypothetical protein
MTHHASIFFACWMLILGGCAHGADFPLIARAPDGWQTKDIARVHWNDQGNTLTIEGDTRSSHTTTLSLSATTATVKTIDGVTTINGAAYPPAAPTPAPGSISHSDLANLGADDHPQYHNDARALTWLGTRSTSDLPEGSNLYFSDARVRAALSAISPLVFNALTGAISITTASATTSGALSKGDWSIFNGKEPAITAGTTAQYWRGDKTWQTLPTGGGITTASADTRYVPLTRIITTNAPLTGGSALSGDLILGITQASAAADGYLSLIDYGRIAFIDQTNIFAEQQQIRPPVNTSGLYVETSGVGGPGITAYSWDAPGLQVTSNAGIGAYVATTTGTAALHAVAYQSPALIFKGSTGSGTPQQRFAIENSGLAATSSTWRINGGSPGAGKIWTASDTAGNGSWVTPSYANAITALTGDVTATGPGSVAGTIANSAVTNAKLANMTAKTVKGNGNVSAAAPTDLSASAVLDMIGVSRGAIVTRGSSVWGQLVPSSTIGLPLVSKGTSADIAYDYLPLGSCVSGTLPMANGGTGLGGVQSAVSNVSMLAFIPYETDPLKDYVTGTGPVVDYATLGGMITDANGRQSIGQCGGFGTGASEWGNKFNVGTTNFTLSAWVRTTSTTSMVIISKGAAAHEGYLAYFTAGKPALQLWYNGGTALNVGAIGSTTISDGNWHLVTWSIIRSGNVTAYVDGVAVGTGSVSAISAYTLTDSSSSFWTGCNYTGGSNFSGNIDEIMIWNRALPASEIRALYLMTQQFKILTY